VRVFPPLPAMLALPVSASDGVVEGDVVDRALAPCVGATVAVTVTPTDGTRSTASLARRATSDAEGRFRIEGVGGSRVTVARVAGLAWENADSISGAPWCVVSPGGSAALHVHARKRITLAGRVTDFEGKPVADAEVRVSYNLDGAKEKSRSARVGPDGSFAIEGLPTGVGTIDVSAPGLDERLVGSIATAKTRVPFEWTGAESGRAHVEFAIPKRPRALGSHVVYGDVLAAEHVRSPYAWIRAESERGAGPTVYAVADANAVFRFAEPLSEGKWHVVGFTERGETYFGSTMEIGAGTDPVEFGVGWTSPAGFLAGRVVDADGAPVGGLTVSVQQPMNGPGLLEDAAPATTTDRRGHFSFARLEDGPFSLSVSDDEMSFEPGSDPDEDAISVEWRTSKTDLEIRLLPVGEISGVIVNESGLPVVRACVRLRGDRVNALGQWRQRTTWTDAAGRFSAIGLAAGTYSADVEAGTIDGHWPVGKKDARLVVRVASVPTRK
jgi:hypothetical protein